VRLPRAALVINFDSAAMIGDEPTASLFPGILRIRDDYQSGESSPRSEGYEVNNHLFGAQSLHRVHGRRPSRWEVARG
jgi:hypothetical protein